MANYLTLVEQLSTAVDQLNKILQGDENTTVTINGQPQPSVQKKTLDEVNAKVQLVLDAAADIDTVKYATPEAGVAATTNGQFFSVVSDDIERYLDLYKNESGAAIYKKSYPSIEAVNALKSKFYKPDDALKFNLWVAVDGSGVIGGDFTGYLIPVNQNDEILIKANDSDAYIQAVTTKSIKEGDPVNNPDDRVTINPGDVHTFKASQGDYYLWISGFQASLSLDRTPDIIDNRANPFIYKSNVKNIKNELVGGDVLSLESGLEINSNIEINYYKSIGFIPVESTEVRIGQYIQSDIEEHTLEDSDIESYELEVNSGDILYFEYKDIGEVILWHWDEIKTPIFAGQSNDRIIKRYTYTATTNQTLRLVNPILESITLNDAVPTITSLGSWFADSSVGRNEVEGFINLKAFKVNKGDTLVVTKPAKGTSPVIRETYSGNSKLTCEKIINNESEEAFSWVADASLLVGVCGYADSNFYIKKKEQLDTFSPLLKNDINEKNLQGFRQIDETKDGVIYREGRYKPKQNSGPVITTSTTINSYELILKRDEVLTFQCENAQTTLFWLWGDKSIEKIPLLSGTSGDRTLISHSYKALETQIVRITSAVHSSIKVDGNTPVNLQSLGTWFADMRIATDNEQGYKNITSMDIDKGDEIVITSVPSGITPLVLNLTDGTGGYFSTSYINDSASGGQDFHWVSTRKTKIALCGSEDSTFFIKKANDFIKEDFNSTVSALTQAVSTNTLASTLKLGEPTNIFLTTRNYIVKTEYVDGVEHIETSRDLGKTWVSTPNIVGKIVQAHMFSDGTLMLANNTKSYWTDDYINLTEASIIDEDGSTLVLEDGDNFYSQKTGDRVVYIGDVEMHVFGDYSIGVSEEPRVWYTADRGRTIKVAAKFGETLMGGQTRSVRHVHKVGFNEYDNKFYVTTGDAPAENMIVIGTYDVNNDTWSWDFTASGVDYKWLNISFDKYYTYLVTDITDPEYLDKNGIYRIPTNSLHDKSQLESLWLAPSDERGTAATARIFKDNNGNTMITPDYAGRGFAWIAMGGTLDFKFLAVEPSYLYFSTSTGINYNGDIYVHAVGPDGVLNFDKRRLNKPTYNLTLALRNAGVNNFMTGTSFFDNEVYYAD